MKCPNCDSEDIISLEEGSIGMALCPACGYSRAHRLPSLYSEVLFDWAEYKNIDINKVKGTPTTPEEVTKCQKQVLSKK